MKQRRRAAVASHGKGPRTWHLGALLAAAAIAEYANALSNPFVWDDAVTVVDNPTIRSLTPIGRALWGPVQTPTAGRPVANLSFAVNYAFSGLSPSGYHAFNLAVHIGAALLLFGIIRLTLVRLSALGSGLSHESPLRRNQETRSKRRQPRAEDLGARAESLEPMWIAFACALLWTLHPLHTEVIDYVTQRTESMMGLAYLLTLYAAIRGWSAVAIAACAAGMLTKESMVTAPAMVLLYDAVFQSGGITAALRRRPVLYAGLVATLAILATLVAEGPRWRSAGFSTEVSPWIYLLNQAPAIVRYLEVSIWPRGLVLDYGVPQPITLGAVLPSAIVVLVLLAATAAAWFRNRRLAFLGTWFFVTLAPTSSVLPIATEVAAERRMYLPLAAVVILLVLAARAALTRMLSGVARRRAQAGSLVAVSTLLVVFTVQRNAEHATGTRIWQTVLDRRPHGRAHYNLGLELKQAGRRAEAIAEYHKALPDAADAHYALGFELHADGRQKEAIEEFREYIRLKPNDIGVIRAYMMLGAALAADQRHDEAADAFRRVLVMRPGNLDAIGGLGEALLRLGRFDEAIAMYQQFVARDPRNAAAQFNLGLALSGQHRDQEAATAFAEAVAANPTDAAPHVNLANALLALGRGEEALAHFRTATELQPDDEELRAAVAELERQLTVQKKRGEP